MHLADDFNFETCRTWLGQFGGNVAHCQRHTAVVGVTATGYPTDNFAAVKHWLVTDDICRSIFVNVDSEHDKFACRAGLHFGLDRSATNELVVELHCALHTCFERCIDRSIFSEPRAEVFLEAHRDESPETKQAHVKFFACVPN